ncbi:Alpha/Beta hydrolase protein [Aspergillus tetrazonus]
MAPGSNTVLHGHEDKYAVIASIRAQTLAKFPLGLTHQDEIIQIPSRDTGRFIKAHFYRSKCNAPASTPLLINFHGSGFVIPFHGSDDEFARHITTTTNYAVLDVAYRLAPENPFPAALEDVEDAVGWVRSQPQHFDISNLTISGFSAGANLALVASSQICPEGTFQRVILFYPTTDFAKDSAAKFAPDQSGSPVPAELLNLFRDCYVPAGVDLHDPRISPSHMDMGRFPSRVLAFTCARDNLCEEVEVLLKKVEGCPGKVVTHFRLDKCDHAWDKSCEANTVQEKEKFEAYETVTRFLTGKLD